MDFEVIDLVILIWMVVLFFGAFCQIVETFSKI